MNGQPYQAVTSMNRTKREGGGARGESCYTAEISCARGSLEIRKPGKRLVSKKSVSDSEACPGITLDEPNDWALIPDPIGRGLIESVRASVYRLRASSSVQQWSESPNAKAWAASIVPLVGALPMWSKVLAVLNALHSASRYCYTVNCRYITYHHGRGLLLLQTFAPAGSQTSRPPYSIRNERCNRTIVVFRCWYCSFDRPERHTRMDLHPNGCLRIHYRVPHRRSSHPL